MNALRQSIRPLVRNIRNTKQSIPRRSFGAGQPESQSMQARLWEGHNTRPEGWEGIFYATYAGATAIITLALGFAPDTSINTWAANEAKVRLDLMKEGKIDKVEFGVFYSSEEKVYETVYDFDSKCVDNPFNEEDDDDDDDEEEEDEEEEGDDDE